MTIQDWAALTVSVLTIIAVVAGSIKWLVKHYLAELKPNSGSSLKDQVSRLEQKVEIIYDIVIANSRRDSNRKFD
jgi:hypothetical protein